jgi:RNA polymerase sigma factor (sigma-70 family)
MLQEVQTEIITSLWRLHKANLFWPWIYKHAWGKVQHHYRDTRKHNTVFLSDMEKHYFDEQLQAAEREKSICKDTQTEMLFEIIYGAMKKISLKQRNILTMRCYEDMSFQEIGEFLDCSETNARVLFFRAKQKIKSQLRRKGYRANRMFIPALGLFGTLTTKTATASAPAAATVSGSSIEVGAMASFIGFLTTKLGILCSGLLSALLAWLTLANLLLVAVITAILIPVILIFMMSFVFDD